MYKKPAIYLLLLFVILLTAACTNNPVFEPQKHQINTVTKWLIDNSSENKIAKISFKEFDRKGNLILSENFNENGTILIRRTIIYKNNLKIENITEFKENTNSITSQYISRFDDKGNVAERVSINPEGDTTGIFKFSYDSKGNIIEELHYDNKGNLIERIAYAYNYNIEGFVIGRSIRDSFNNKFTSRDSIIYRPDEQQVERIVYNEAGKKQIIYTYVYDNAGNVRKEIHSDNTGKILKKYIYEYTYY
jgi:hypothetical protein